MGVASGSEGLPRCDGQGSRSLGRQRSIERLSEAAVPVSELRAAMLSTTRPRCEIAEEVGVSPSYLRKVLAGSKPCRPELGRRILEACGWPVHYSLRLPDDMNPALRRFVIAMATEAAPVLESALGELCELLEERWAKGAMMRLAEQIQSTARNKQSKLYEIEALG